MGDEDVLTAWFFSWRFPWKVIQTRTWCFINKVSYDKAAANNLFMMLDKRAIDDGDSNDDDVKKKPNTRTRAVHWMERSAERGVKEVDYEPHHIQLFITENTWYNSPGRFFSWLSTWMTTAIPTQNDVNEKFRDGVMELEHLNESGLLPKDNIIGHQDTCGNKVVPEVNSGAYKWRIGEIRWNEKWRDSGSYDYEENSLCEYHWLPSDFFGGEEIRIIPGEFTIAAPQLWYAMTKLHALLLQVNSGMENRESIGLFLDRVSSGEPVRIPSRVTTDPTAGRFSSPSAFTRHLLERLNEDHRRKRASKMSGQEYFMSCIMKIDYSCLGAFIPAAAAAGGNSNRSSGGDDASQETIYASFFNYKEEVLLYPRAAKMAETGGHFVFKPEGGYVVFDGVPKHQFISLVDPAKTKVVPLYKVDVKSGDIVDLDPDDDDDDNEGVAMKEMVSDKLTKKQMTNIMHMASKMAYISATIVEPYSETMFVAEPGMKLNVPVKDVSLSSYSASTTKNTDEPRDKHELIPGLPYSKQRWGSYDEYFQYYKMKHPRFALDSPNTTSRKKAMRLRRLEKRRGNDEDKNFFRRNLFSLSDGEEDDDDVDFTEVHSMTRKDELTQRKYFSLFQNKPVHSIIDQFVHVEDLLIKELEYPLDILSGVMKIRFCSISNITDLTRLQTVVEKYAVYRKARDNLMNSIAKLEEQFKKSDEHMHSRHTTSAERQNIDNIVRGLTATTFPILVILGVTVQFPEVFSDRLVDYIGLVGT